MPILGRFGRVELQRELPDPVFLPASALDWPNKRWISYYADTVWPTDQMTLIYRSTDQEIESLTGYAYHDESGRLYLHSSKPSALNNVLESRLSYENLDRYPMILAHYQGQDRIEYLKVLLESYIDDNAGFVGSGDPLISSTKLIIPFDDAPGILTAASKYGTAITFSPQVWSGSAGVYGHSNELPLFGKPTYRFSPYFWLGGSSTQLSQLIATERKYTLEYHIAWYDIDNPLAVQVTINDGNPRYAVVGNRIDAPTLSVPFTFEVNRYYHIAFVRDFEVYSVFVDGQLIFRNYSNPFNTDWSVINSFHFNLQQYGPGYGTKGYLANVRFSHAARYTGNFSPPTEPYPTTGVAPSSNTYLTAPRSIRMIEGALEDYEALPVDAEAQWRVLGLITKWTLAISTPNVETGEVGNRYASSTNVSTQGTGNIEMNVELNKMKSDFDNDAVMRSILLTERGAKLPCQFFISDPENSPRGTPGISLASDNKKLFYQTTITFTNVAISTEAPGLLLVSADFVTDGDISLTKE